MQPAEIDAYVASGEWRGKAGGYAVQGIAAVFTTELRGSHTNVIGLPLAEVLADLLAAGALARYPRAGFGRRRRDAGPHVTPRRGDRRRLAAVRARIAAAERPGRPRAPARCS